MKSFFKKALSVVITGAIIVTAVPNIADAEIVKYYGKDDNGSVYEYNLVDLVTSLNGDESLFLNLSDKQVFSVYDDESNAYIDFSELIEAANKGEDIIKFAAEYIGEGLEMPETVISVTVDENGEIQEEEKFLDEQETEKLEVIGISAIDTTFVEVTFDALEEALTDVTVEVKDSKGNVVEVKSTDIPAGATSAQFDFVKAITSDDKVGVWTVDGVEYSFTELKLVADIVAEAGQTTVNEVKLLGLLNEAGIENVNAEFLAQYATKVDGATPAPEKYADVQKLVNKVNEDNAETETLVTPVLEAKTQLALLAALEANYDRVNKDWIMAYAAGNTSTIGIEFTAANTDNKIYNGSTVAEVTPVDVEAIQAVIDAVNSVEITTADTAAVTLEAQAKVTALIQNWVEADDLETPNSTPKADAIKASQIKEGVFRVKEATTQNSVYNALVSLANLDNDTLKAANLNSNIASFYFAEQQKDNLGTTYTVAQVNTQIVSVANDEALKAAMTDIVAKFGDLNADNTNATKKAAFKTSLQKLADYTSHLTGTAKFNMSIVNDENLVKYSAAFAATTAIDANSAVSAVKNKIDTVNDAQGLEAALEIINDTKSTAAEVRNALLEIAVANETITEAGLFINLVPQARLEVAELVKKARVTNAADFTMDEVLKADGTGAIKNQVAAHAAKIGEFNAIGDLDGVAVTKVKSELDTYGYDNYKSLTTAEKIAVAEEISKLVHVDKDGLETAYDFSGDDAVETLAEANAIIDEAIGAIK